MLSLFTEPPYKIFEGFLPNFFLINDIDFIKSFDGIVEWHEGDVVAHYKRKID